MKTNRFYRVIRAIVGAFCRVVYPTRVIGVENIPAEGPVLLCSNHISMLDPVLLICSIRRQVSFLAKKELFSTGLTNWFFRALGMVPVDRGASDIQALRVSLEVLNNGGVLGIFPQGHRHRQDECREIQNGAAMLALRSKAQVVAAHVSAPMRAFRRTVIRISEPIDLSDVARGNSQSIQATSKRIASNIWQEEHER